jgi:pimeloyl-ACP methyl ester carboxylesterase
MNLNLPIDLRNRVEFFLADELVDVAAKRCAGMAQRVATLARHLSSAGAPCSAIPASGEDGRTFQYHEVAEGVTLRAVVEGEGPLVVLLHGFPQGWYLWRNQIEPLKAAGYKVCAPDLRGYGGSSKPKDVGAYNHAYICQDVVNLATALGQPRFLLVGHDFGCHMAWECSLRHPDNVLAVCGLDVPYATQSNTMSPSPMAGEGYWYITAFQPPNGPAQISADGNIARWLYTMYYAVSGDSALHTWLTQLDSPPDAVFCTETLRTF